MRQPLIAVPRPSDFHPDLARILVANALWCAGISAANPDDRADFEALLGLPPSGDHWPLAVPFRCWEDPPGTWHTQGVSTCGLVAEGIALRSGVDLPWRGQPYHSGTAIARAESAARLAELAANLDQISYPNDPGFDILPGDIVVIGKGTSTHELLCTARRRGAGGVVTIESIDGGQVAAPDWMQSVQRRRRILTRTAGVLTLKGAPVHHRVRLTTMPWSGPCIAPVGWKQTEIVAE